MRAPSVVWALAVALALACASAPPQATPPMNAAKASISDVRVVSGEAGTTVTVVGPVDPVYTAFQQEDPPRVVVDLAASLDGDVPEATAVYDGMVEEIAVTPFALGTGESRTRLELSLSRAMAYDVVSTPEGLELRIGSVEVADAETPQDTPVASFDEEAGESASSEAPVDGPPGTALLEVASHSDDGATRIHLIADGTVEGAESFVLESPSRLVIDLPGMVSKVEGDGFAVGSAHAQRVRVGQHADKVRVVIDATDGFTDLAAARLAPSFDGLVVTLAPGDGSERAAADATTPDATPATTGNVETLATGTPPTPAAVDPTAQAMAAIAEELATEGAPLEVVQTPAEPVLAPEPTEAPVPAKADPEPVAPQAIQVYGVQFDREGGSERLVVLSDRPVQYHLAEPEPGTLMLQLPGATIDPEAAVRIAPEPAGTVSLVTAFQQPELADPEVRVVVRKGAAGAPAVSQRGTMLILDFPKTEPLAAAKPAPEVAPAPSTGPAKAMAQTAAAAIPDPVPAALEPMEPVEILEEGGLIDGKSYSGRRISLDFKDVDIADVLRLIAEVSDLNIIAGDEVKGEVTIRLVDVPWDQALDVILLTKGLGFVRVGNVLRIAPSELLKAEEEARLQEKRAKEKLEDLMVKLQPVNYASVDEVSKMITRLLTPRGTVDVDKRTNTLILKDIKSVIDEATALIKAIDTQTPQVLIEAKIVEANLDFSREIGSTWAFGTQPFEDGFDSSSAPRRDLGSRDLKFHDNGNLLGLTDTFNHVQVANPITSVANGLLDLGAFLLDEKFNLELRLEAAESNGEGKVISSPRVVTLDNRKAKIEQGVSIPFQTFENGDAKLEFIDAVLKLEVTPHITADRSIIMQVEVQRNAPDDSVQTPTGSPAIAKNQATTETLIKDGQTLVIGGIYVVRKADRQSRVPYFHKIPLIGAAFRNTEVRDIRQELLVFVTPRIVVNPELGV